MGSKSSETTVGYWFKLLYHTGLTLGPIDAFLEFRGGDKTAWSGRLTASGTININQPNLWGGEKDQGGIVSDVHVMFGEATQAPDSYLVANLGNQVAAWRGLTTLAFLGGYYGANNPYPQSAAYKVEKILQGWDGSCWYPEKAPITMVDGDPAIEFSYDGGASFPSEIPVELGAELGTIRLDYATGPNPDKFEVWFDGVKVIDTGYHGDPDFSSPAVTPDAQTALDSYLIGAGLPTEAITLYPAPYADADLQWASVTDRESASFLKTTATTTATVRVYGPLGGTLWHASLSRSATVGLLAINPAHALYYLRTHSTKGREPTGNMNDASFTAAADKLYAEGFGICVTIDPSKESVVDVENRICKLIGGSMTRSMVDGQYYLDLARGDYVLEDLPILTDDDILSFSELPASLDGGVNSVSVRYFDPQRKETIITPAVEALGLIDEFGLNHQVVEYPEIPTATLAARIAERDLLAYITPKRVFDLTTTRKPYSWRPNTYFRLQSTKRGITDMVCIVGDKQAGTLRSGAIRMQAVQDIYTLPAFGSVEVESGVDTTPATTPVPIVDQVAFEAPYINVVTVLPRAELDALAADAGFLIAAAQDPANSRDFTLSVDAGAGYQERANGAWCPTAVVNEAAALVDPLPTAFTLSDGKRLDQVDVGDPVLWGSEICRVDALDVGANTITLGRACADTVEQVHAAGETLWFWTQGAAYDVTEYTDGESVNAKLLTNTWSERLSASVATAIGVTFNQRQARPYPPGKLRINASARPASVTGEFVVTWAHRDRTLQADQLLDADDDSVGPESTVRYALQLIDDTTDAVLVEKLDIAGATATCDLAASGNVRLVLYAISDRGDSWQRHEHVFAFTAAGGTDSIVADTYAPAAWIIDGNGG